MVSQNAINNTVQSNDLTVARSLAATAVKILSEHTDDTSGDSNAIIIARSGGAAGGDACLNFNVNSVQDYTIGIDNSDSDKLKVTTSNTPSAGTTLWSMTAAGERTMPLQPAFMAYLNANQANKTGNGASYTLGTAALTEVYDQGGDFNVNGTFTAPVTGRYLIGAQAYLKYLATTVTYAHIQLTTSNRTYYKDVPPYVVASTDYVIDLMSHADMDAGDTLTVQVAVYGMPGATVSVYGAASCYTFMYGALLA